jgi:hypothetical protein
MGEHKHNPNAQGNVVPIGFRQARQRCPVPSPGWCVITEEELESRGGILLAPDRGVDAEAQRVSKVCRLVATSGFAITPNGTRIEHGEQPGDLVFLVANAQGTKDHPLWPSNTAVIPVASISGHLPDEAGREAAKMKARADAAGIEVPETVQ